MKTRIALMIGAGAVLVAFTLSLANDMRRELRNREYLDLQMRKAQDGIDRAKFEIARLEREESKSKR